MSLSWIFGIIGTLGVGGLIAFAVLAPAAAALAWQTVLEILRGLLATRFGCVFLALLVCAPLCLTIGDNIGDGRVQDKWDAANVAAAAKVVKADANIAADAAVIDKRDTASELSNDKANTEARNAYVAELEKRAAGVCTVDDADLRRLRNLR